MDLRSFFEIVPNIDQTLQVKSIKNNFIHAADFWWHETRNHYIKLNVQITAWNLLKIMKNLNILLPHWGSCFREKKIRDISARVLRMV